MNSHPSVDSPKALTVDALEGLINDAIDLREKIKILEEEKRRLQADLDNYEKQLIEYLTAYDKSSLDSARGKFVKVERMGFSWSKLTPDQKQLALAKFRERGEDFFNSTVSVNHNTLNSLCNQELDVLREEGKFHEKPFGVFEPTASVYLQFRGK